MLNVFVREKYREHDWIWRILHPGWHEINSAQRYQERYVKDKIRTKSGRLCMSKKEQKDGTGRHEGAKQWYFEDCKQISI